MGRMNTKNEGFFAKRLSFLLAAGLPLTECLRAVGETSAAREVETGKSLAEVLSESQRHSSFTVAVIRIGESSGTLAQSLSYLADELQKGSALRAKALGALIYPAVIALMTIALTTGLIVCIFPKVLPVFDGLGVTLPWTTLLVMSVSEYCAHWGLATFVILLALAATFTWTLRSLPRAREIAEAVILRVPVIGTLMQAYYVAATCRILATLLESGMPLPLALRESSRAIHHSLYARELTLAADGIERGGALAEERDSRLFPETVLCMITVGESSGTLAKSLAYLADYYTREVDEGTMRLTRLLEPALMVGMGCVVGFVAVSMITPMYEITQHLNAR